MGSTWCLTATSGPVKGSSWSLGDQPLVIGRSRQCQVFVHDPAVSRLHCELILCDRRVVLKDLGSANATLLNGRPVQEAKLRAGDEVAVGPAVFVVTRVHGLLGDEPDHDFAANEIEDRTTAFNVSVQSPTADVDARPRTVHDLAHLFDIGRELCTVATVATLVDVVRRHIGERFGPAPVWIVRFHNEDEVLVVMHEDKAENRRVPTAALQRAIREQRPVSIATEPPGKNSSGQILYAAPVLCGGVKVGAIAVEKEASTAMASESDSAFLMALAHEIAPHILSVERLEQLSRDIVRLRARAGESTSLIGQSDAIKALRQALREAAQSNLAVLLLGETGTGKELAARLVHDWSRRAHGPFVVVNCAAIPGSLFESEMFGHERGAFTGADRMNLGRVQQAHGGTLFLDEIGELAPESQARMLRLVENGTFFRVGSTKETSVDIRIVAATNRDIPMLSTRGQFREDLYHRLNGFEIRMPALRERPSDIPILAEHFLEQVREEAKRPIRGLHPDAIAYLRERPWPGNVRELRRCIERAVALARSDVIGVEDLLVYGSPPGPASSRPIRRLADVEREHIVEVLRGCHGKVSDAAQALGIGRSTLYNKIAEYEIDID